MNDRPNLLQRWISVGDVIVLVTSLLAFAFTYGKLSQDVQDLREDVAAISQRPITPEADRRTAVLEARVAAHIVEANAMRSDILVHLNRIEQKLDTHIDHSTQR